MKAQVLCSQWIRDIQDFRFFYSYFKQKRKKEKKEMSKYLPSEKKGHYIMWKGSIQQEEKYFGPNTEAAKYVKQILTNQGVRAL